MRSLQDAQALLYFRWTFRFFLLAFSLKNDLAVNFEAYVQSAVVDASTAKCIFVFSCMKMYFDVTGIIHQPFIIWISQIPGSLHGAPGRKIPKTAFINCRLSPARTPQASFRPDK